ncbi:MAG: DUF3515 family protein [Micromonosporaceae bacterium]
MSDQVTRGAARVATLVSIPAALLAGVLVFWLLGGAGAGSAGSTPTASPSSSRPQATTPVEMAAPPLSEREEVVCRALLSQLPRTLRDLPQRPVTAGAEQNAAYGDPPITIACGGEPADVPLDALLWRMSHVCWYAEEHPDYSVWTAVDREVPVRVTVPAEYEGPGEWANEFSSTLVATVFSKSAEDLPTGCR